MKRWTSAIHRPQDFALGPRGAGRDDVVEVAALAGGRAGRAGAGVARAEGRFAGAPARRRGSG